MRKIFKYLRPYTPYAILAPLFMMCEVLADLALPKLMRIIVDCGITGELAVEDSPLATTVMSIVFGDKAYNSIQLIITFGVLMLAVVLVGGVFGVTCAYFAAKAAQSFGNDLRCDTYAKVMSFSIEQTDRFTTGSLITRMTNDITLITHFIEMLMRMFVRSPIFFVGGIVMLLSLNVKFGFVLMCGLPIMVFVIVLVLRHSVPLYSTVQKQLDKVNSVVGENVSGARVVKAYVMEDYESERFDKASFALMETNYRVQKIIAFIHPALVIVQNAAVIAVILIGGIDIRQGVASSMSTGTIMAAITYITQVLMSVMMLSNLFQTVSRSISSAKRVSEVLSTDPAIVGGDETQGEGEVAISFKNVSFKYPDTHGEPILHDINFDIKKGETFAIIGSTGCGKTSLVSLIPRFYDVTDGEIFIDGRPIGDYELKALRKKMSYVMQKSELFSDTISGNIRWGKDDATVEEICEAAKAAQADDFITSFSDGYDTFIAEKGASLSGGQKQRMSIARALVRKPEILILDDATSALDLVTEAKLHSVLREKLADTTVVLIAQRIASVRHADRIAIIEGGTIKEIGTHESLMKTSATYRDIYDSQNRNGGAAGE